MDTAYKKAVEKLKSIEGIDINGKNYTMVKDRIKLFRDVFEHRFGINTECHVIGDVANNNYCITSCAKITDAGGAIVSSGNAMVRFGSSDFTTDAPMEVAETSAIGRALATFGLAGDEFASAEELAKVTRGDTKKERYPTKEYVQKSIKGTDWVALDPKHKDHQDMDANEIFVRILNSVEQIDDLNNLTKYWSQLAEYRQTISEEQTKELIFSFGKAKKELKQND